MTRLGVVDLSKKVIDNVARVQRRAALHILPEGRKVITKFRIERATSSLKNYTRAYLHNLHAQPALSLSTRRSFISSTACCCFISSAARCTFSGGITCCSSINTTCCSSISTTCRSAIAGSSIRGSPYLNLELKDRMNMATVDRAEVRTLTQSS